MVSSRPPSAPLTGLVYIVMASSNSNEHRSIVISFDVLAVVIPVLCLFVTATAILSSQVQRRSTWYTLLLSAALYPASFTVLIGQQNGRAVPVGLCAFQAVLMYTLPTLAATAFACFVVDFYHLLKGVLEGYKPSRVRERLLLALPIIMFIIAALLVSLVIVVDERGRSKQHNPSGLRPDESGIYCHTLNSTPTYVAVGVSIPAVCVWFIVYVKTVLVLKKHRPTINRYDLQIRRKIFSVFIRTSLMTVGACIGVALGIQAGVSSPTRSNIATVFEYLVPSFLILLLFGTQQEFFRAWMCCNRKGAESVAIPKVQHDDTLGIRSM